MKSAPLGAFDPMTEWISKLLKHIKSNHKSREITPLRLEYYVKHFCVAYSLHADTLMSELLKRRIIMPQATHTIEIDYERQHDFEIERKKIRRGTNPRFRNSNPTR